MKRVFAALVAVAVFYAPAFAQTAPDPKATVTLTYAELDAMIGLGVAQSSASAADAAVQSARQRAASGYAKIQAAFFPKLTAPLSSSDSPPIPSIRATPAPSPSP